MTRLPSSALPIHDGGERKALAWLASAPACVEAVDMHAHVFVRGLPLAAQRRYTPEVDAPLAAYAAHLRKHGLSHALLVQPSFLGTDNRYLLDALRRFPQRLRGVAAVGPSVSPQTLAELDRDGIVGIRLNLVGAPLPDLRTGAWRTLCAAVRSRGWHIELHCHSADLPALAGPLVDLGCTVVVDHFGRPDPTQGVDDAGFMHLLSIAETGRVWVKLSAAYRNTRAGESRDSGRALAQRLIDAFGVQRLVWGSDWPHTQHHGVTDFAATRAALDTWVPDASARAIVLREAPAELLGFR
jgi:predicted TIM-barrel fold metal-dependent hydrolase